MAATPIDPSLVHDATTVANDGDRMAWLVAEVSTVAQLVMREALRRETALAIADVWIQETRAVLGSVSRDPTLAIPRALGDAHLSLTRALSTDIEPPSDTETSSYSAEFARGAASVWIELLRAGIADTGAVLLDETLQPAMATNAEANSGWDALAADGVLSSAEVLDVFARLGDRWRSQESPIELPLGLRLSAESAKSFRVATTGSAERDRGEITHSGAQPVGGVARRDMDEANGRRR